MNSICLVIPYFAKSNFFRPKKLGFPKYFSYFIKSFSGNNLIDLKILTNISFKEYEKYQGQNITVIEMSFADLVKLISKKLDLKLNRFQLNPYKLCDYKPALGLIFSEYLQGYDFWGYCDVDMVIGNLSKFFNEKNLKEYEMVSASRGTPGYMTIYRNNERMRNIFTKSPDYLKVFRSSKNYRFDESGGNRNIIALRQIVQREKVKINNLPGLVHNDGGGLNIDRDWKYIWQNGKLTDCLTGNEIGSLHILKSKRNPDFIIEPIKQEDCRIEITAKGIACY
jgi:hypothetical protein